MGTTTHISTDTYAQLLRNAFSLTLNASDFFHYATADAVVLDTDDLPWVLPVIEKYGQDGIHAVMAHIRQKEPIKRWLSVEYEMALNMIKINNPDVQSENDVS
jgi:hypothetical protein